MIKYFLTLFASSASVVVLLMATNFTFISSHSVTHFISHKSLAPVKLANLSMANPALGLTKSNQHNIDANWGCSCPLCTQLSQSSIVNL